MKLSKLFVFPLFLSFVLFLSGCQILQNAQDLTPEVLIKDLSQDEIAGFMTEVKDNMKEESTYRVNIQSEDSNIKVLLDGENYLIEGSSSEGEYKSYKVDEYTYTYSGGKWIKYNASGVTGSITDAYSDALIDKQIENTTYLGKENCPDAQGTCYVLQVKDEKIEGKIFINATRKLPVRYEHLENGTTSVVTYDFDTTDKVVLPDEAKNAISIYE